MTSTILDPGPDDAEHLRNLGWSEEEIAEALEYDQTPPEQIDEESALNLPGLLPEEFWNARDVLKHIRKAAWAEGRSADPAFYGTVARLSGMKDHRINMRTGLMGRGSLNLYAAIVGDPGDGKTTGADAAVEMTPAKNPDFRDCMPLGSGEGIAEVFMGWTDEETGNRVTKATKTANVGDPEVVRVRKQVRHNAFFACDEGERLTQLSGRQGQTLEDTLRSAAMGGVLGSTNATEDRNRYVAKHSYSLGLLIGYQPSTVRQLLSGQGAGTPQRFFWSWAWDPKLPFERTANPGELALDPRIHDAGGDIDMGFPESVRELIWRERVLRNQRKLQIGPFDGHRRLMTAKMAALLALLEGRFTVVEEDWELAEMVWTASCAVRDCLAERAKREMQAAKNEESRQKVQQAVLEHKAKRGADMDELRVAGNVARYVAAAGVGGITYSGINRKTASRDRELLEDAISLAITRGWVVEDCGNFCVGPTYGK